MANRLKLLLLLCIKVFCCIVFVERNLNNIQEFLEQHDVNINSYQGLSEKLVDLEEFCSVSEIIEIYNYILTNIKEPDILIEVVKLSDSHKDLSTMSILLNILLLKNSISDDTDSLINLRAICAKAISNYKDNSTIGALLYCLNNKSENYKVRLACADALGRIGDKYAVAPLINVVQDEDEKSVYVKESAAFALGLIGDSSAIDPLVAIIEAKQGLLDKFSFLKEKIIEALGKFNIKNNKVLKVLKMSLSDSSSMVRINAIEALMNSDYEEAEELIRIALKDEDSEVQKNALIALYNIIGRDILDEVISLPGYSEFLKQEAQSLIEEYEEEV